MKTVSLGGIESTHLGYGAMSLTSNIYATPEGFSDEQAIAILKRVLELGITHIDTAIIYGNGENEKLVGRALKGISAEDRGKLCIATKTGFDTRGGWKVRGDPAFIRETCMQSLERLGMDYIDIFYLHRIDTGTAIEESMNTLKELVQEGKIKSIGLSEASANTIRRAHAVHPIAAVQLEWSLWSRDVEPEIIPTCRELGIGIVAYSPLGRGMLTGSIKKLSDLPENDWRRQNPRFTQDALDANLKLVKIVEDYAAKKGCTPANLALAWVLAQGDDVVPIPGTARITNLEANMGCLDVKLTKAEADELKNAIPEAMVVGDRYGPGIPTFADN